MYHSDEENGTLLWNLHNKTSYILSFTSTTFYPLISLLNASYALTTDLWLIPVNSLWNYFVYEQRDPLSAHRLQISAWKKCLCHCQNDDSVSADNILFILIIARSKHSELPWRPTVSCACALWGDLDFCWVWTHKTAAVAN